MVDDHQISYQQASYGKGNSAVEFLKSLKNSTLWEINHQKQFKDL